MAMTPRGCTINALATELERDRRTIAKKLARVRPIEVRGRSKYYRLRDALDALDEKRPARSAPRVKLEARLRVTVALTGACWRSDLRRAVAGGCWRRPGRGDHGRERLPRCSRSPPPPRTLIPRARPGGLARPAGAADDRVQVHQR